MLHNKLVSLLTVGLIMDQNSDVEIELYEEIIEDSGHNSPRAQAPSQKCWQFLVRRIGPNSKDPNRMKIENCLPTTCGSPWDLMLAKVFQVPQNDVAATRSRSRAVPFLCTTVSKFLTR